MILLCLTSFIQYFLKSTPAPCGCALSAECYAAEEKNMAPGATLADHLFENPVLREHSTPTHFHIVYGLPHYVQS